MASAGKTRVRVGLVGVGNWARYGHIPALQLLPEYEIVAVSSRQRATADEIAKAFDIRYAFDSVTQLVTHPEVDLVVVLPPAPQHAAVVRAAIEAGKDVYCEWPLTTSTHDSEALLKMAEDAQVRHVAGLQRRLGSSALFLRDLLANGYVGKIRSVRLHVSMDYFGPKRPPALAWSLGAANFSHVLSIYGGHFLDTLFHVVAAPKTVGAIVATQDDLCGRDEKARRATQRLEESLVRSSVTSVESVEGSESGTLCIAMSAGLRIVITPDGVPDNEDWRFFAPGVDANHFVIEGGVVDPCSLT